MKEGFLILCEISSSYEQVVPSKGEGAKINEVTFVKRA